MRVTPMVRKALSRCTDSIHAKRLNALVRVSEATIQANRLVPASIGRRVTGGARPKHGIKSVDRLLGNPQLALERWVVFRAIAARLLSENSRPIVLIDWTQPMGTHQALVAAVPIGGRSLPLYIEVHPQEKLSNVAVEAKFLCMLQKVLPAGSRPIIVTDAGFKGPFFLKILELGWHFVGRIRGTSKAITLDGAEKISKEQFYARATTTPKSLGRFQLFVDQRIPVQLVLVRKRRRPGPKLPPPKCKEERELRQSALDPWLLATSLPTDDAATVVGVYAKRMQIEEMFRDAKSHRFGWSLAQARTGSTNRAANLLLIAAIALTVVTLLGLAAEQRYLHRAYQANTRQRRVLSFFALGCIIVARGDLATLCLADFLAALSGVRDRWT